MATNNAVSFNQLKKSVFNMKNYVNSTRVAYVKSETECVAIDTSTMKDSFVNNSYTYEQDVVSYLEEGIEYHVEVNGVRYRCLCINNIPGKDIVYETIYVQGDGFSLTINNKVGYSNNQYNEDVTKSSVAIELSDRLLQNPPVIKVIKMNIKYMPTYLMPKDLDILNSLGMNRIGKIGTGSVSLGYNNVANNDFSTALGVNTSATAPATLAHGGHCVASANYSHAEGYRTESSGMYSHSEGIMTLATGQGTHAEGFYTMASGLRSHAEGSYTLASSQYQHVEGKFNVEDKANKYAHIVGNGTSKTARKNAHTLDWEGNAWYAGEVQGTNLPYTISSKVLTTVPASNVKLNDPITVNNVSINKDRRYYIEFLGNKKLCSLLLSEEIGECIICSINNYTMQAYNNSTNIVLSIGKIDTDDITTDTFTDLIIYEEEVKYLDSKYLETDLTIQNSISLGRKGKIGPASSAIGYNVEASGFSSHAEGSGTIASGEVSHAEGDESVASGEVSHAEGVSTIASGTYSHAEGNSTKASGYCSHAEGIMTTASANQSHAEGAQTTASGSQSHAEGSGTIASGECQHVQGKYNIADAANKYAHIVGNGSKTTKSNAHTLDWNGNGWYAGKLSQDGTPTGDTDLTTKKYVDDKIAGIVNSAPETLDTLKELSTALGDDPNFATTVATNIGKKVDKVDGMSLTHNDLTNDLKANYDAAYAYSQAKHSYNDLTDKPTIPSIDGLATEEYVQNAIASAGIGTGSDVATDDEVKTTINAILGGDYIE